MFDTLTGLIESAGYLGIFVLMFVENLFPPIPSEVIMPLAGFLAARGDLGFIGVVVAGTAGSVLGALPWYYAGALLGEHRLKRLANRHGRWLTMSSDDVVQAKSWFNTHGRAAVFFGRLIPAIRTLISVPAGIASLPLGTFLFFTTAGSALWTAVLTLAGYLLHAEYERVAQYLDPASKLVIASVVLIYLYRLIRQTRTAHRDR